MQQMIDCWLFCIVPIRSQWDDSVCTDQWIQRLFDTIEKLSPMPFISTAAALWSANTAAKYSMWYCCWSVVLSFPRNKLSLLLTKKRSRWTWLGLHQSWGSKLGLYQRTPAISKKKYLLHHLVSMEKGEKLVDVAGSSSKLGIKAGSWSEDSGNIQKEVFTSSSAFNR